ncbi:MAG: outer membrane lipoprotein-sorting protein [Pseudobdellovibrio sp.]
MKIFILIAGLFIADQVFALSGIEIVKKADQFRYIEEDNSFIAEVNDLKGTTVQKSKFKVSSRGSHLSLVETIFPERQAGRKLLMKDDDLWFYTPDIKRPTRVSMQQKLTGEVSNGDIARTNFGDDYTVEVKGPEKIDSVETIHLALKKNKSEVTYPLIEYWVNAKNYMPLKAVFKSDGGKELKLATYSEPKVFFGRTLLTKMEIVSAFNKNQKSVLIFTSFKKEKLNESFFNKESLNN